MNNMLFETHMHLLDERFDGDRGEAIGRAVARGVGRFVEIADFPADWGRAVELARTRPGQIFASWGFHPHYAQDWKDDVAQKFLDGSRATELVALGEIGLDAVRSSAPVEIQLPVFRRMLDVARRAELPVVIHCREAFDALWPALEEHCREGKKPGPYWGVIHCFSGGIQDARKAVELGFLLGVDGPVTYPKNEALRQAVAAAGLENIVLETDSPYLPPQSLRGKRNEPANIAAIADFLAGLFGIPAEAVADATTRAAQHLFRLKHLA